MTQPAPPDPPAPDRGALRVKAPIREIRAWAMYDWANSAYTSLSITVLMFFITLVAVGPESVAAGQLSRFAAGLGFTLLPENCGPLVWSWGLSLSMAIAALLSPILGAMADARAAKRRFLAATALPGAIGAVALAFLPESRPWLIVGLFFVVSLFFELSFGFYNGFLPELADDESMDRISAMGFAYGYVGGGLALALQVVVFTCGKFVGIDDQVVQLRIGLAIMGLWWGLFSLPAVLLLRDRSPPRGPRLSLPGSARQALGEVVCTLRNIRAYRTLALFLLGFLFYNDGIQTVISQAPVFAERDLNFAPEDLLPLILAFQFICLPGALVVGRVTERMGQKRTLMICLAVWVGLLATSYFIQTKLQFWMLSIVLGLVMGGTQSVARAMMGVMTPPARTAEFFGFFNFSGRATSWLGTFLFGAVVAQTGSARLAILSLLVLFIIGWLITLPVNVARGRQDAARG
jgi:UMF1 family MFS transporter